MALIATSTRLDRSRRNWPIVIEIKMSTPRLHHSSGTTAAKPAASATPATTATTRSRPLARRDSGVTCTTSIAVSGASSGSVPGKSRDAATYADVAATVIRADHNTDARPSRRTRAISRDTNPRHHRPTRSLCN